MSDNEALTRLEAWLRGDELRTAGAWPHRSGGFICELCDGSKDVQPFDDGGPDAPPPFFWTGSGDFARRRHHAGPRRSRGPMSETRDYGQLVETLRQYGGDWARETAALIVALQERAEAAERERRLMVETLDRATAAMDDSRDMQVRLQEAVKLVAAERNEARARLAAAEQRIAELEAVVGELAESEEANVRHYYGWPNVHPANAHKFERDMGLVRRARALLPDSPQETPR